MRWRPAIQSSSLRRFINMDIHVVVGIAVVATRVTAIVTVEATSISATNRKIVMVIDWIVPSNVVT